MNGIILVIPIILVRYGLLGLINKDGLRRAAYYPPVKGNERLAFWIYQITIIILFLYPFFFKINLLSNLNIFGLIVYIIALIMYIISVIDFSRPINYELNTNGIYKLSRNPMYVAFFLYFLGISMLINSLIFFFILIAYQISVHYLILSEERWCIQQFGKDYRNYMKKVRRYI